MILTILFGYIPIVIALVGGSLYFIDYIISTIRVIITKRKIKKELKAFSKKLSKRVFNNGN